jgi:hypothetical protein
MTATTTQETAPIDIERFSSPGLIFETSADLYVSRRNPLDDHGRPDRGTVIVMLEMDGEGFDVVVVEEHLDSLPQLDKAIEALPEARNALARVGP